MLTGFSSARQLSGCMSGYCYRYCMDPHNHRKDIYSSRCYR